MVQVAAPSPLAAEFAFRLELEVSLASAVTCPVSNGERRLFTITAGKLAGPLGTGQVLPGGTDLAFVESDGLMRLDVRAIVRMEDGALICITYRGMRDPAASYWRILPTFETSAPKYQWLTRVLAVGVGSRTSTGPAYEVHVIK